jgi:very-short-patch-repair endonuclease
MTLRENAKRLRSTQTDAERRLWYHLRAHRFLDLKFRRQKPIGPYIVDFVCHEKSLVIELDGGQHAEDSRYDAARDAWLRARGYTVLRFWNNEVMQALDAVLERIRVVALSPGPSPASGRGEPRSDTPSSARGLGE